MSKKMLGYFMLPVVFCLILLHRDGSAGSASGVLNPGPDIITGDIGSPLGGPLQVFGSSGTQVGLGMGTTVCNAGTVPVDYFRLPDANHPVIPQNLYRMSGGSNNDDHFEQIGQAWVKHAFGPSEENDCGFGCTPPGNGTHLGAGCADTYLAEQNAFQGDTNFGAMGSRAWINPFTGNFSVNPRPENHAGHVHTGTSHRLLVESNDLNPTMNPGATYYAEVQYLGPHEYAWCQTHPGECNMYNNASYRQYNVTGTTNFTFAPAGQTVRMTAAIKAWTGATINPIEPEPGVDGRGFIAYKVTGPDAGVWHYEYAIYNMNLDRAIQSFSVPLCGIAVSNIGFHAPPQHPGFPNDGTLGDAGFSSVPWTATQTSNALSWSTETFAQNQNANAIRWGTLYNFRFDSAQPPQTADATVGFFKTGTSMTVAIQGPSAICNATPTPSPTPSPTPPGPAQAINLSTRLRVQTGDNVGIGGFIITGTAPKHVLLRALGPSITGLSGVLADPVLELHGPAAFATVINDNWRDDSAQQVAIMATGLAPAANLESAIDTTLNPGAYTAVVRGKNNTAGVALVEVYDLSQGVAAKLANLSTRAFVSTGDNVVIAGITLGSHRDDDRIVVRGLGPSLTAAGVTNALANPTLELRNSNGGLLASNNDWQETPAQAVELTGAGLAPTNPLESGIATTLPAGVYTALLLGVNSSAGVGLVEVYDRGGAP